MSARLQACSQPSSSRPAASHTRVVRSAALDVASTPRPRSPSRSKGACGRYARSCRSTAIFEPEVIKIHARRGRKSRFKPQNARLIGSQSHMADLDPHSGRRSRKADWATTMWERRGRQVRSASPRGNAALAGTRPGPPAGAPGPGGESHRCAGATPHIGVRATRGLPWPVNTHGCSRTGWGGRNSGVVSRSGRSGTGSRHRYRGRRTHLARPRRGSPPRLHGL